MLVLSRMEGQRILLDGDITVTVLEVRGDRVRLGIEAPPNVSIWRDELSNPQSLKIEPEIVEP